MDLETDVRSGSAFDSIANRRWNQCKFVPERLDDSLIFLDGMSTRRTLNFVCYFPWVICRLEIFELSFVYSFS